MAFYTYDGSFEGFLTCVHAHYYKEKAEGISSWENYRETLLGMPVPVQTDSEKAEKVYKAIETKISKVVMRQIYYAFCSSLPDKEMDILQYLVLAFPLGSRISLCHANPVVKKVEAAQYKVSREVEKMLGLVRFSILEGNVLYAKIEPDHDIIEFLADHFSRRLNNEIYVLHDAGRSKAVLSQQGNWYISAIDPQELETILNYSKEEKDIRDLWKKYFETIAIKERTNPRCQRNFMPQRYWKNLTEMNSSC